VRATIIFKMFNFQILSNIKKSERTEAVDMLIEDSYPRKEFYLVSTLSTGIATIGLLTDSMPLLIGSMIIAPLLYPIMGAGMGIAVKSRKLFFTSVATSMLASFFALVFAMALTQLFKTDLTLNHEALIFRMQPSIAMGMVALFSGFVSSLAITTPSLNTSMSGVAVSVSLIPPIAATGIGLVIDNWQIAFGAAQLFVLNLLVIMAAATLIFSYLDFGKDQNRVVDKSLKAEQAKVEAAEKNS